jgi:hypothetical protein
VTEFWSPDARFSGQTVFVVGGGPSLVGFDFSGLAGRRCVAVNAAGYDLPAADILLFHDNSWFEANRELLDEWRGLLVTPSRHAKATAPDRVRRVELAERPDFPIGCGPVRIGHSSGQTAVSLAITLGAARVVLLGFDMQAREGRTHYHRDRPLYTDEHTRKTALVYATEFLPFWQGWSRAARAVGCEVMNATPGSALDEFPLVDIEDVL